MEHGLTQGLSSTTAGRDRTAAQTPIANATPPRPTTGTTSLVSLRHVSKTYANGTQALINTSLEIKKGDFLFVTGPSGSGKSTLLKLLYGEEKATEGEVLVNGCNLADLKGDHLSLLRRQIGIVFQDYKLIPRRTVAENVAFALWAQGYPRQEIQRRLTPALKMVGLTHKTNCFPDELSGGEQQRVSIARAIVGTPPLLLADEPTGNLDTDNSLQVIKILNKLNAVGITVVVTTHDERLMRQTRHPVMQLRNGYLIRQGHSA